MHYFQPILTKKEHNFSIDKSFDESVILVWNKQIESAFFYAQNNKSIKGFDKALMFSLTRPNISETLNSLTLATRFIDYSHYIYANKDRSLFFIYSSDLDRIYKEIIKKDSDLQDILYRFPCPSWFKPSGYMPIGQNSSLNMEFSVELAEKYIPAQLASRQALLNKTSIDPLIKCEEFFNEYKEDSIKHKNEYFSDYKKETHFYRKENCSELLYEGIRRRNKRYEEKYPERVRESKRKYQKNNPDKDYRFTHPEKHREYQRNYHRNRRHEQRQREMLESGSQD